MADTKQGEPSPASILFGEYDVPSLAGVTGDIEFVGPKARVHARIDDGHVVLSPGASSADTIISSDEEGVLLKLVRGEINVVTTVLQDRVEASGDPLLGLKVAGSMPDLARQVDAKASGGR